MATRRISVDIDEDEHKYLKLCCTKLGVSIKDFVVKSAIDKVDEWEDTWMMDRWEKDGTREEIERESHNPDRTTFRMEKVDSKFLFTEMRGGKAVGLAHEI